MSEANDPWAAVAAECPRRILRLLHEAGHYRHGSNPRFPGKVLCVHKDSEPMDGWEPTPAQAAADGEGGAG